MKVKNRWNALRLMGMGVVLLTSCVLLAQEPEKNKGRLALRVEESNRVANIVLMLPERPEGVGPRIEDRAAWARFAAAKPWQNIVAQAEKLVDAPLPEVTDDLYLEFSRTGNRLGWQRAAGPRHRRLQPLVLAECVENEGRFLEPIERLIDELCSEVTWVLPSHDRDLNNFYRKKITIDLWSSAFGWDLATTDWLLGDKLSPATRELIRENIRWRILDPFREMTVDPLLGRGWMGVRHNWNAVCLAGVTGIVLEQIESREERARLLSCAIRHSENYLKGYDDDGYCSEGLSYWNYGMGHYVLLSEMIRIATGGEVDLLERPLVPEVARFAVKLQMADGVYPAFADCSVKTKPNNNLMTFINRRWGLGLPAYEAIDAQDALPATMIYFFGEGTVSTASVSLAAQGVPKRDWFDKAGILIARPEAGSRSRLTVALKGGNNKENHNHNDVGSYVVALGKSVILLDPGNERYTARTFSARRYESNVLNSFGHPVPLVAGQLQREGAEARAEIVKSAFSGPSDFLSMNIRSAYAVESLERLVRSFLYSREGDGSLTVTDEVEFSMPQTFETALITGGTCERQADGRLFVSSGGEALQVTIDAGGLPFEIEIEEIKEETAIKPLRIGIRLAEPVLHATITARIEPLVQTKNVPVTF